MIVEPRSIANFLIETSQSDADHYPVLQIIELWLMDWAAAADKATVAEMADSLIKLAQRMESTP